MAPFSVLPKLGRRAVLLAAAAGLGLAPAADAQLRGATGITYPGNQALVAPVFASTLGDVNADGFGDMTGFGPLPGGDEPGFPDSFALFGARTQTNVTLGAPSPRLVSFPKAILRRAGDVNGDGRDDVLVNIGVTTNGELRIYGAVVFGGPGVETVRLDRLGSRGFQILGEDFWVPAGDVNGDGRDDLATLRRDPETYESDIEGLTVIYGKATSTPVDPAKLGTGGAQLTSSVNENTPVTDDIATGDFNGDGRGDVGLVSGMGRGTVVFGSPSFGGVDIDAPGARGFRIDQLYALQRESTDFTGDGRDDLIAYDGNNPSIVPGQTGTATVTALPDVPGSGTIGLPSQNVTTGAEYPGSAPVGDVNRDGRQDVLGATWDGRVYLVYGRSAPGRAPQGPQVPGVFANVLRPAGDVDGDGAPDVVASLLTWVENPTEPARNTLITRGRDILPPTWAAEPPSILPKAFRPGDTVDIRGSVTEPSTVELVVRRANGSLVGTVRFPMTVATQAADWDGRVNGRALPPGEYRTTATLIDGVGLRSAPTAVPFTVLP
ncbi:hypothetical protein LRS13_02735 [Svornostia abyssi]|uniref:FG-GAP repeat protein n=1 Tax=Svornostia abyssi TaxID=2898438 RepID=A0ABY5PIH6_9ACTN|nr:hypothetical protein LRS13_02735 [Parviterribacteraceae bacterium J379]